MDYVCICFGYEKRRRQTSFVFYLEVAPPEKATSKKNKKGLASVILATNSPNSELVVLILIESLVFVNKKHKKISKNRWKFFEMKNFVDL